MTGCVKVVLIAECGAVPETVWKYVVFGIIIFYRYIQTLNMICVCTYILLVISWLVTGCGI
jgi:hypothetical protein